MHCKRMKSQHDKGKVKVHVVWVLACGISCRLFWSILHRRYQINYHINPTKPQVRRIYVFFFFFSFFAVVKIVFEAVLF